MPDTKVFVGIDVSKAHLDVGLSDSTATWRVPNTEAGIETLVTRLAEAHPALVVMEATGGFEIPSAAALTTAGLAVVIANPRQVRDFAKSTGQLAKNQGEAAEGRPGASGSARC
jgi:transposase